MYYVEWAHDPKYRHGFMLTLDELKKVYSLRNPGHQSVYMFREEYALKIKKRGHSTGFSEFPVASDRLIIDIDGGEDDFLKVQKILEPLGLRYDIWSSGGKGYHLVFPHTLVESKDLPYSHKQKVIELGLGELADMALYRHSSMIALPGRIHSKTKKRKTLVDGVQGKNIEFPIIPTPIDGIKFNLSDSDEVENMLAALDSISHSLMSGDPTLGDRHTRIWGISRNLSEGGLDFDTALSLMQRINELWTRPKPSDEVERAVKQAYGML